MQFIGGILNLVPEVLCSRLPKFLILVNLVWVVKEMVAKFGSVKKGKLLRDAVKKIDIDNDNDNDIENDNDDDDDNDHEDDHDDDHDAEKLP